MEEINACNICGYIYSYKAGLQLGGSLGRDLLSPTESEMGQKSKGTKVCWERFGVGLWSGCGAEVWLSPESSVGRKLL